MFFTLCNQIWKMSLNAKVSRWMGFAMNNFYSDASIIILIFLSQEDERWHTNWQMTPTNCTLIQWSSLRQWPYLQTERKKNRAYGFRQIAQLHTRKKNHPEILNHQWSIRFWQHKTWPLHNASFPSSILPFIPGENSWHWNLSTLR